MGERDVSESRSIGLLKPLAEVAVLFCGMAFVTGWSYLAAYYSFFGLNPLEIDVSVAMAGALAVHVLMQAFYPLLLLGVAVVVIAVFQTRVFAWGPRLAAPAVAIMFFVLASVGLARGRSVAKSDLFMRTSRLSNVGFTTAARHPEPDCVADGTLSCKLLLHVKSGYYFFVPIGIEADPKQLGDAPAIQLGFLPDSQVTLVRTQRGFQ